MTPRTEALLMTPLEGDIRVQKQIVSSALQTGMLRLLVD